jgi:hypothetical protein
VAISAATPATHRILQHDANHLIGLGEHFRSIAQRRSYAICRSSLDARIHERASKGLSRLLGVRVSI